MQGGSTSGNRIQGTHTPLLTCDVRNEVCVPRFMAVPLQIMMAVIFLVSLWACWYLYKHRKLFT